MRIYLGSDHAGFALKQKIVQFFQEHNYNFQDLGNIEFDKDDDYPDYGLKVAKKVAEESARGILICGSSFGICMVANKIKGIRAASVSSIEDAKMTREHNDANIICLSGWHSDMAVVKRIIDTFLDTKFSTDERHIRRVEKIKNIEDGKHI